MYLIAITHGEAQRVELPNVFRPLTENGRAQEVSAATRLRQILPSAVPELATKQLNIDHILSSPAARCVETAFVFAGELKNFTSTTLVMTEPRLGEKAGRVGLTADDVIEVLKAIYGEVVLLSVHGDFAGVLPGNVQVSPAEIETTDSGVWFRKRPVFAVIRVESYSVWEHAELLACHAYDGTEWHNVASEAVA